MVGAQDVADVRAAARPNVRGIRGADVQFSPLATHYRPADAGQQVDPGYGKIAK